jgi:SAM-dependent methyltransferase
MNRLLRSAGSAHERFVHSRRARVLAAHFAELIGQGHLVLDVGCGDGLIDRLVLDRRADLDICGVDPLVRPNACIRVLPFDGQRLPFPDRSWDTVLFCDVLHHTERPVDLLREAVRVARRSVVIKDHCVQGMLARTTLRAMDVVGNLPHGVPLTYNYLRPEQWQDAWRATGLVPREVRRKLGLYAGWGDLVVGRSLHFLVVCDVRRNG